MNFKEFIKKILGNNKKTPSIIVKTFTKTYGTQDPLEIGLYYNKEPLTDETLTITIHGQTYTRKTDKDGICRLNINLKPDEYPVLIDYNGTEDYNSTNAYTSVYVKSDTRIEGTDIIKTSDEKSIYQCAVYDTDNNRITQEKVNITVNGVTYNRTLDDNGLARLNINLSQIGVYNITAEFNQTNIYNSSNTTNTITVKPEPEPTPAPTPTPTGCTKPYTSSPHPTNSGCNGMGQNTSTYCAPSSVHKCLYKFGIRDISQATLASWMATNSSGTSHQGIETGIAKVNQVKGTNIKIQWYNKSDLSWEEIGKILCQPNKAIFCHILYKNGGTCSGSGNYGHYELLTKVNTDTGYVKVLNSLGGYCGSCYCGFYQDRTMACQEQFMRGISQKSIAVLTKQ